jgi:hypothetical protein
VRAASKQFLLCSTTEQMPALVHIEDFTGYSCRWIGNMECAAFKFQCDGSGIVDCTGNCPGGQPG